MKKLILFSIILNLLICPVFAGVTFDKIDDEITCGNADTLLKENGALTISAWINPVTVGEGNNGAIVSRVGNTGPSNFGVDFNLASTSTIQFRVLGIVSLNHLASNNSITTGSWQHVLVTWDGSTTAANSHIYVNGTEVSYQTTTNGNSPTDNSTTTTRIGNNNTGTDTFDGNISEVAVWGVELSAQDIALLSLSRVKRLPLQISPSNLKAYWPLDEGSDTTSCDAKTFIDESQQGNTGTGSDGANNTGLTCLAEAVLSYP